MQQISKDFVAGFAFGALELARAEGVDWAQKIALPNFGIGAGAGGVGVNLRGNGGRVRGVVSGIYAEVVPQVLQQHARCTFDELLNYAQGINPSIKRDGLQAYLATARRNHLLNTRGSRGHMKYSLSKRAVAT